MWSVVLLADIGKKVQKDHHNKYQKIKNREMFIDIRST